MADDFVMRLGTHGVQSDDESFMEAVGKEVDLGPKKLSDQGAGLIEAFDLLAGKLCEGHLKNAASKSRNLKINAKPIQSTSRSKICLSKTDFSGCVQRKNTSSTPSN